MVWFRFVWSCLKYFYYLVHYFILSKPDVQRKPGRTCKENLKLNKAAGRPDYISELAKQNQAAGSCLFCDCQPISRGWLLRRGKNAWRTAAYDTTARWLLSSRIWISVDGSAQVRCLRVEGARRSWQCQQRCWDRAG